MKVQAGSLIAQAIITQAIITQAIITQAICVVCDRMFRKLAVIG